MATIIDPPGGWRYGFPKIIPDDVADTTQWLLDNGYPEHELNSEGKPHWLRSWIVEDEE